MINYLAGGTPAQIVRVSYTTLFQVSADYLGNAMYWTHIAVLNGLFDPWIVSLVELKIPQLNEAWYTDGILGAWMDAASLIPAIPAQTVAPVAPTAPATITLAQIQALIPYLPTTLPDAPGVLWSNGGELAIS